MCREKKISLPEAKKLADKTTLITGEIYGVYESSKGNYNYISTSTVNYDHYTIIYETKGT